MKGSSLFPFLAEPSFQSVYVEQSIGAASLSSSAAPVHTEYYTPRLRSLLLPRWQIVYGETLEGNCHGDHYYCHDYHRLEGNCLL